MKIWEKNWFWFKRIQIEYWWYNFKSGCTKRRHCDKGFHTFGSGWVEHTNHKKEVLHSDYIHCNYCNCYFFPTKKDKENYLRIKESEQSMFKNFFDQMKPDVKFKAKKQKVKTFGVNNGK